MIRGLRLRLLLGFGLVLALGLVLAGFASMLLLRDREAAAAEERIGRLVEPLAGVHREMQFVGWSGHLIAERLEAYASLFGVRVFLVDGARRVVFDSDAGDSLVGELLAAPGGEGADGAMFVSDRIRHGGRDLFVFASGGDPGAAVTRLLPASAQSLVVAVPAGDVTEAWAQLLPRLLIAGGSAALVAVVASAWLSARITRPIAEMTRASQAMARGEYGQRIEVRGRDEVADLARAFNQMAQQVDRSSRSMRQLIADVSHELKTPLTSIQGFSQALADGVAQDEAEARRAAGVVREEAERMRALVDDLLYLSRIESGELRLAAGPVDLDALAAAAARRFRYQAEQAGVALRLEAGGAAVSGDGRRLEQVLANLLDNALRFAPAGSEVSVRTRREDGGGAAVVVHNGGEPIPAADLPHIFDRFYQADRARAGGGHSGLGLAIAGELAQAHGGTIGVRSSAAEGTAFTVRLPASIPPDANARTKEEDG